MRIFVVPLQKIDKDMKFSYLLMAAAMLALSACGNKEAKIVEGQDDQAEQTGTTKDEPSGEVTGRVTVLVGDKGYTPDMKVEKVTVLDFNATRCGPCRKLHPVFDAMSAKYPNVEFVSVDVDANAATAELFGVQAIPQVTMIAPDGRTKTFVGLENAIYPLENFQKTLDDFIAGK